MPECPLAFVVGPGQQPHRNGRAIGFWHNGARDILHLPVNLGGQYIAGQPLADGAGNGQARYAGIFVGTLAFIGQGHGQQRRLFGNHGE